MPVPEIGPAAAHRILARAAFGARAGDAVALARQGLPGWIEEQLALAPEDDAPLAARLAALELPIRYLGAPGEEVVDEVRPLTTLSVTQADRWARVPFPARRVPIEEQTRPWMELSFATILRRAEARAQLRERMAEFWHDHFSVHANASTEVRASLPEHDRRIRRHALGNFRALLEEMASSPAMLFYLNNQSSRAGAPNENYARELLELHTLGREAYAGGASARGVAGRTAPRGGDGIAQAYADGDVWEAARAFTGWSMALGQRLDAARVLPRTGEFTYVAQWHDPYQKRVLGRDLDPFAPALADGRAVLEVLAAHPATARFVCGKLARFLIGTAAAAAPGAVARAVEAFTRGRDAPDQIARTVRALLDGPEIAEPAAGRVRRPVEFVVAAARAYGIALTPNARLVNEMGAAGQVPFGWPAPDGRPIEAASYLGAGALQRRWQGAVAIARNLWGTGTTPLFAGLAGAPLAGTLDRLCGLALGPAAGRPVVAETIAATWAERGRNPRPGAAEVAELTGWVLAAPAFQST